MCQDDNETVHLLFSFFLFSLVFNRTLSVSIVGSREIAGFKGAVNLLVWRQKGGMKFIRSILGATSSDILGSAASYLTIAVLICLVQASNIMLV